MINVLGSSNVTVVYYLFIFFSIEAALAIAWGQWRRSDSFRARRLTIAYLGLTALRLGLLALVLFGLRSSRIEAAWIPPFERVLAIASLGFVIWAFTPLFREKGFLGTVALSLNGAFAIIFYVLAGIFWGEGDFNQSPWEVWFVLWQMALVVFGAVTCAIKLDDERTYVLFGFVALLAGYVAHIFLAATYTSPHVPVWVRMAELVAYPLFAIAVYQGAIQSLSARSRELQNLSQVSLDQIKGLIALFEATRQINSSLELPSVLDGAAESVANALGADLSAIALPEDSEDLSQLRLVSIYNPTRKGRGEAVTFPLNDQQVIKHALKRKYQVQIDEYRDNSQIRLLFAVMGSGDVGPLLVQPLLHDSEPIGVLIVGNPVSKRVFTDSEEELCKTLADQVSGAIGHARDFSAVSGKAQQLSWTLRNQELETGKRQAAMETELKKSREEVTIFAQRLHELETAAESDKIALDQAQERMSKLNKTVDLAKVEVEKARQKEKQIEALTTENDNIKYQLSELETQRQDLLQRIGNLEQETAEVEHLKEALEANNQRSRKLARALKRARARSQQAAPVPAVLSSAEADAKIEDLSCGVIIGDTDDKIKQANAAASHMLSRSDNNLINSDLTKIFEDERWSEAMRHIKAGDEPLVTTTLNLGDSVIRATISPMASSDNHNQEGTVTILYDITSEAESQQARDEFVASLSQELRTPMTSITGYTDLLLGESVGIIGEMQRKFLQRVKANIERMGSMLNDLIGVTAIDAGQLEIRPVVVDMAEVIEDVLIHARAQLEENEITLEVNLLEDMPLVEVDPDSIRQIISNLLSNAIKSTPFGSAIGVSTSLYETDGDAGEDEIQSYLKISIRDSGGGIAEKDLDRVFDRFYQAERPLIQGLGETGVGLAIVKSLIEAHGGRVWVESEMGQGSTFHFILLVSEQFNDPWLEVDIPPLDLNSDPPESG